MRTIACLALSVGCSSAIASGPWEARWGLDAGVRQDELDWSIAGGAPTVPSQYIDVLSELSWTDLQILELRGHLSLHLSERWLLSGSAGLGGARSGDVRDSDYLSSGHQREWSRSQNNAEGSFVFGTEVAFGHVYGADGYFASGWRVVPWFGLAYNVQDLRITDGNQTVSQNFPDQDPTVGAPPLGPFGGLDSSYRAEWFGPWAGLEVGFAGDNGMNFGLRAQYHFLTTYYAAADWNLRGDFAHPISFEHEADGQGVALTGSVDYTPARERWSLGLGIRWQRHWTEGGTDTVFLSDGRIGRTRLNEVTWTSHAVDLRWRYLF